VVQNSRLITAARKICIDEGGFVLGLAVLPEHLMRNFRATVIFGATTEAAAIIQQDWQKPNKFSDF
jgi:hypothetical protein